MEDLIVSIDIGATKITASICSMEGILFRCYQRTKLEGPPETIPMQVISLIDKCFELAGAHRDRIIGTGVSTAGPFEKTGGKTALVCHNMCGGMDRRGAPPPNDWTSIPLQEELEKHLPNLKIENDAVAGAIAERTFGAGKGSDNLLYVTWSTGIGTGAFVDGRLIRGKNGNAPHGGHVYLGDPGPVCGCGNVCDLESIASGTSIAIQFGRDRKTSEVFEAYRNGDDRARNIIDHAAVSFARGMASINSVLDTEIIVIGGSVFLNNIEILLPMVKEEFYRSFPALSRDVVIVPSVLGEYLGDIAALSLVIPHDWIGKWKGNRPWERAPETFFLD